MSVLYNKYSYTMWHQLQVLYGLAEACHAECCNPSRNSSKSKR